MNKKVISLLLVLAVFASLIAGCAPVNTTSAPASSDSSGETVTLEFTQWWEPELPEGSFRALMDEFEAQNPGIQVELISGPYATTKEQVVAGAAAGTMSDVVGLDGAWVSDFVKQGSLASLTDLMAQASYDDSELAAQIQLGGATYMIPVVNFVYPVFVNLDLMEKAGIAAPPTTRSEFADAAQKLTDPANNVSGWILPLSLEQPNGIQNDVMSWVWASGGSMMKEGQPDLTNDAVRSVAEFIKGLYDAGAIAPGAFSLREQDKVEEFTNGRVGMMVSSLAPQRRRDHGDHTLLLRRRFWGGRVSHHRTAPAHPRRSPLCRSASPEAWPTGLLCTGRCRRTNQRDDDRAGRCFCGRFSAGAPALAAPLRAAKTKAGWPAPRMPDSAPG